MRLASGNADIWRPDERGARTRITLDPNSDLSPIWSPDGARIDGIVTP
jgi:hypothetical protein